MIFQYIMVGGFATNLNGFSRTTADIDVWLKDSPDNRNNLRKSLEQIGLGDFPQVERMDLFRVVLLYDLIQECN